MAEYTINQIIPQKIRYIEGKHEQIIKAVYTLTEVKEAKSIGEGVFAKIADGKFIIVRFKVHNKSNNAIPSDILTDLVIIDNKKRRWNQSIGATGSIRLGTESFGRMEIGADKKIEDVIVFDVYEDVRDYVILLPGGAKVSPIVQKKVAEEDKHLKVEKSSVEKKEKAAEDKIKREPKKKLITEKVDDTTKKSKPTKTIIVNVNTANLRHKPSLDSSAAMLVNKGSVFEVLGELKDSSGRKWYKVRKNGKHYWVIEKVVRVKGNGAVEKSTEKSLQDMLDEANAFYREGRCEDFINANEKAIEIASRENNLYVQGRLHYNVAECYTRLNKYDDAQRHIERAIVIGSNIKDSELEILALIDKSKILIAKGDKKGSVEIFKAVSGRADKEIFMNLEVKDYIKAMVSMQMADILLDMGDENKAKERLEYALMINHDFKQEENIVGAMKLSGHLLYKEISNINNMLDDAWALYEKGDYKGMEGIARVVVENAKKLGYKRGIFGGNYYIAMSLINMDEYDKAIDYALIAQELSEKGNDETRLGMVYNLIGNIFKQKKSYEKALYYYNKYFDSTRKTGNKEGEAVALSNIGNVLMDKGEYKEALKYYEDSLKVSLEIGRVKHIIAQAYLSIGRVLKKLGDYKNAEKSIAIAINIFKGLGNEGGEIIGLWEMADNYSLQLEYSMAIKLLEENLGRAERFGMRNNFIDDIITNSEKNKDYLRVEKYKNMKTN
ncbi:hypothetical protein JZK55_18470 [Dissulfurispira thermophila]|uniref:SH3b domain-containing protein n=2 Tax=root TaxID=1 RepID=A0A7G1H294_9BACT|nr:tetratricopeptide repeat protein [Dissulfurispira thermophila]BCB96925.1 hypothetical protein JZK55_18470 [Dissulfurispira thermophila]